MKYLIDTQALIWYLEYNPKLSQKAWELINNDENELYISIATFWEMAIKINLAKLSLKYSLRKIAEKIKSTDFIILRDY